MNARYALYFAPAENALLWQRASQWLGRDSISGEVLPQPVPEGLSATRFEDLTESARRYGFHATMRSPFRLAPDCDRARLLAEMVRFAGENGPVALGPATVQNLGGFLAIMPTAQSEALTALAARCVTHFEPYRAPLSEDERTRRMQAELSPRQAEYVDRYGYPYVMEEFRFHMTLTDRLDATERVIIQPAAESWFGAALASPLTVDRIVLYYEPEPGMPFFRLDEIPLTGQA